MNPSLIEKLRKLLALGAGGSEHEAKLALAKASALALEHNIDLASIEAPATAPEPMVKQDFIHKAVWRRPVEHRFVSTILKDHFNVDIVWGHRGQWHFIGKKADTEFAGWLCGYLLDLVNEHWKSYAASNDFDGAQRMSYRNTFTYGWFDGLGNKLSETKEEVKATKLVTPATRERYALVMLNEAERRDAAKHTFFPQLTSGRRSSGVRIRNHDTLAAGRSFGSSVSCHRPIR